MIIIMAVIMVIIMVIMVLIRVIMVIIMVISLVRERNGGRGSFAATLLNPNVEHEGHSHTGPRYLDILKLFGSFGLNVLFVLFLTLLNPNVEHEDHSHLTSIF